VLNQQWTFKIFTITYTNIIYKITGEIKPIRTLPDAESMNVRKDELGRIPNKTMINLYITKIRIAATIKVPNV
jgi:hypothetical protein